MCCDEDTAEVLRTAGHKLTQQRLVIVRTLRHSGGHVSATDIAELVKDEAPLVDVSTVYRTLDVLKRMRLVTATDMGGGDVEFEWTPENLHHHMVCTSCNESSEFEHSYLNDLTRAMRDDFGFKADMTHFAIFGLCKECSR